MSRKLPSGEILRAAEFRSDSADGGDGLTLTGYAAVFDVDTEINSWEGTFNERIAKGAFKKTLRERKPVMQFDHGHDARVGSTPIGVFTELTEDDKGLRVEGTLFDNPVVEPVRQAIAGKAIDGMSFRFRVIRDEWTDKDGKKLKPNELYDLLWEPGERGPLQRTIKEVKMSEAGPVVFPAYVQTSVGVRSLADMPEDERRKAMIAAYLSTMDTDDEIEPDADPDDTDSRGTSETDAATETSDDAEEVRTDDLTSEEREDKPVNRFVPRVVPDGLPDTNVRKEVVMKSRAQLLARHAEVVARMKEIDEENRGAVLDDETQTEWDSLNTEDAEIRAKVKSIDERADALKRDVIDDTVYRAEGTNRGPEVRVKKSESDLHDLDAMRKNASTPEAFIQEVRDNAARIAEKLNVPGSVCKDKDAARESVLRKLEDYDADNDAAPMAKRLVITSSKLYERAFGKALRSLNTMGLTAEEARALAVGVDSTGGFAVPAQLDPTIIDTSLAGVSPIRQLARVETITGNKWQGITSAGVTVSRDAEAEQVSDDSPSLARPELQPTRVQGFVPFSYEIDADWGGLRGEIVRMLNKAKLKEENVSFWTGDGTGNNPEGVITGLTSAQIIETASGTALVSGEVYALEEALPAEYRANAAFAADKPIYNKIRQFAEADGHDLWERLGNGQPSQLLGYPAYEATAMDSALTAGQKVLLFGDFEEGFIIVDRVGMSVELIPNLFGANGRPTGQRGIFAIWRNGSGVLVPNAFRLLMMNDGVA